VPPRPVHLLLFAALLATYLFTAPALEHQHWDSLEYPYACENRAVKTVWGNHPLGHVVLCGAYRGAQAVGYDGRALPFMRACNAVIGALSVILLIRALEWLGVHRRRAIAWGLLMAGTYGFWLYAGTADIYGLSLLAMLLAWRSLLRAAATPSRRHWLLAGVIVGLAVVTHQFNGPLLVATFVALVVSPPPGVQRPRVSDAMWLGAISGVLVIAGYWTIGVLTNDTTDWRVLRDWIVGYGSDPTYGRSFHGVGFLTAMWTASDTLLRMTWTAALAAIRFWLVGAIAALLLLGIAATPLTRGLVRTAAISAVAQLAVGVPLIWWWAPDHVGKWWLLMLPALVVILAAGVEVIDQRGGARLSPSRRPRLSRLCTTAAFVVSLGCVTFTGLVTMRPMRRADPAFADTMASWARETQPADVIVESDVTAHLLFWTHRPNALFIYRTIQASPPADRFARLRETFENAWREGRHVYYVPGMVDRFQDRDLHLVGVTREEVTQFFERYSRVGPVFRYRPRSNADEREVYRLLSIGR
jgi:hypothetical protein